MGTHWNLRHGMSSAPIYKLWSEMRARCEKQDHPAWPDYGGRGIRVCERWASFEAFYEDFGRLRISGTTIDRIDNNKGYEPDNVRWATKLEQARNKRNNVRYTAYGESKTVAEWTEDPRCNVRNADTIKSRIYKGWSIERAITESAERRGPSPTHPIEKRCSVCGAAFIPHKTKRKRQKTCSKACAVLASARTRAAGLLELEREREVERRLFRDLRVSA